MLTESLIRPESPHLIMNSWKEEILQLQKGITATIIQPSPLFSLSFVSCIAPKAIVLCLCEHMLDFIWVLL